jgi:transposase
VTKRNGRRFSAEEKVRIVLEGLRGEESVAELCRREGLAPNLYSGLRAENTRLKQVLAETVLENRLLKKSLTGSGSEDDTCG